MTDTESNSRIALTARIRRGLRELDPARYGWLGLLSVPGYLLESLAFMQGFALFFLLFLWVFVEPLIDHALQRGADAETEPTDWIHMGDWREWAVAYLSIPVAFANPLILAQDGLQLLGSGVAFVRHRGSVPDPDDERPITYRLPVDGTWTVVNGSLEQEYSHSWLPTTQRYAYDLVVTDDDGRSRPAETNPAVEEYYCYDEPVLAPADGVVVDVLDTDLEPARGGGFAHPLKRDLRGNYVTMQHAPEEYSCLAHLTPGSVAVEPGDRVERGQPVGRCGHSGNSSEPHLHFQFQDHPAFEMAAGIPPRFDGVSVESPWLDDADGVDVSTTHSDPDCDGPTAITAGQRVATAAPDRHEPPAKPAGKAPSDPTPATDGAGPSPPTHERTQPMRSRLLATLQRLAFGGAVAGITVVLVGVVAGISGVDVGPLETALVLAGAAVAGLGWRALVDDTDRVLRPGGLGTPLGVGGMAALWATVPTARSPAMVLVVSVALYVGLAEFHRTIRRQAIHAP